MTQSFFDQLHKAYNKDELRNVGNLFLDIFYRKHELEFLNVGIKKIESFQTKEASLSVQKAIYCNPTLFNKLMQALPPDLVKAFNLLTWEGPLPASELEKTLKTSIIIKKPRSHYSYSYSLELTPSFSFFKLRHEDSVEYVALPDFIREKTKQYLPKPADYDLTPIKEPSAPYIYYAQTDILSQIDLYLSTLANKQIELFSSTGLILKKPLNLLNKHFVIREFYTATANNDLDYLRSKIIFRFLRSQKSFKSNSNKAQFIKTLITQYSEGDWFSFYLDYLLKYVKNKPYYSYSRRADSCYVKETPSQVFQVFADLPIGWIGVENLCQHLHYRGIHFSVFSDYCVDSVYVEIIGKYGKDRRYVVEGNIKAFITLPMLKGLIFLFASFGLLDIAYDVPQNKIFSNPDKTYMTPFDGVKAFRLTELGRFVFGQTKDFSYEDPSALSVSTLTLDTEKLHVTITGDDPLKRMNVSTLARQISPNRFVVSFLSFLKDCQNKDDVNKKIAYFKEYICGDIPPIWQQFFDDALNKVEPLAFQPKVHVYKFNPKNKELLVLFVRDEVLKKLVQKVDGYQVAISQDDFYKVRDRLRSFGFLMNN